MHGATTQRHQLLGKPEKNCTPSRFRKYSTGGTERNLAKGGVWKIPGYSQML